MRKLLFGMLLLFSTISVEAKPLKILFLGDKGHHQPADRYRNIQSVMAKRGIDITYTEQVNALNDKTLSSYDGLLIYANTTRITPEQEKALLNYVASGHGFIPVHCASYCFLNSEEYIKLVGAQFQRHGTGTFRTTVSKVEHPITKGFTGFESWDETYQHHKHNEANRTVLEYRGSEPWTWVRTHGKGRVFYTAWGHDARTWTNPGFQNLMERGIRWAVGDDPTKVPAYTDKPEMTKISKDVKPFKFTEGKLPFYPAGERWGTIGEPITKMQMPLEPAESLKHMVTPTDFEVKLFAAEPDIGKPIAMTWDERGRLWLAETVDYPNELKREGEGRDRIRICEDTNNDGKADKFTIFADKLSIPTSLVIANGGVIVHQAPHTLFLKDTDGDDKADVRRVLFTGWSTNDTHAGPSNLRYGLDNWLWGMVGYAGYRGRIGGERHSFRQGFYRFKPDGSKMEFVRNTNNNSWGVGISEEGVIFGSTANGCPSVYMPIANRYYEGVRGWSSRVLGSIALDNHFDPITKNVRQVDHHGGFTAGAGHALYTARTWPQLYWNRAAFVNGPTGHLTATFFLQQNGADYIARNAFNIVASDDEWAAPIVAEVGPDGNVWVIDWYNIIVQHNPTPQGFRTGKGNAYETNLRDKKHGRIYRLVYKNAKKTEPFTLKDADTKKLVETLKHENMLWRLHAQRLLVERGKTDVVDSLVSLVQSQDIDKIGLNTGVIHALWTLDGLNAIQPSSEAEQVILKALVHPSAGVRRNAVKVLPNPVDGILKNNLLNDVDGQVRLAASLALADAKAQVQAGPAIADALTKVNTLKDRWLPDALTAAAAAQDVSFLQAITKKKDLSERALGVVAIVAEHYARGAPQKSLGDILVALSEAPTQTADAILTGLGKGWPTRNVTKQPLSEAGEKALPVLFTKLSPGAKGQLIRLAGLWGTEGLEKYRANIAESLMKSIFNEKVDVKARIAAVRQLIDFQPKDGETIETLLDALSPQLDPALAQGMLEAIGTSQAPEMGPLLLAKFPTLTPAARQVAIRVMVGRPTSTKVLLEGLEKGKVQLTELSLDQKQFLQRHPDKSLASRATKILERGGGLPSPDRQKVLAKFLPLAKQEGKATLGKEVFKMHCAKCHKHSGEGAEIGPDLTGMAVHPKEELLVHILDPNRSVEGNFRAYTVQTADGRALTGMLASETKTSIELYDAEGKKHILLREDIDELIATPSSLMPEGFEKQIKPDEMVNLLSFLTQRGKYLPIPLNKVATIDSTHGMFFEKEGITERLIFPDWKPKTFEGVPFVLVDPKGGKVPNTILLHGPQGNVPPRMPKQVTLPCNAPAKSIHFLSGVSGWGHPLGQRGTTSMIVRLHYKDGKSEDHELKNGIHFADYIRRVEVPESKFAFRLRNQQMRYLAIHPKRNEVIKTIDLIKGEDRSAPIVMAVTVETE